MTARLALLIDGENIAPRYFPEIARHCLAIGELRNAQVFADFSADRRAGWLDVCRQFGVQPMLQLSGGKGKNSADIAMTIAAMDVLHTGAADAICLVSSDRDFIPLAQRLRSSRLKVFGIGVAAHDKALAESCDKFMLLDAIEKVKPVVATLSKDERAFMRDLIEEVCAAEGLKAVLPSHVMNEVRKRRPALADRVGNGKFLKRLRENGLVVEHGSGEIKMISAAKAA